MTKQSNLKKLINKQTKLDEELTVELGFYPIYKIEFNPNKWSFDDCDITWHQTRDDEEYTEEAIILHQQEDLTLFLVYSCTGDKYYMAVDNKKEIK